MTSKIKIILIITFIQFCLITNSHAQFTKNDNKVEDYSVLPPLPEAQYGNGFLNSTHLLSIHQGTEMSKKVNDVRYLSLETATGDKINFYKWYKNKYSWIDSRFLWFTQVEKDAAIIWGFSTGELGEKYYIKPSLTLGFIKSFDFGKNNTLTIQASTQFFGKLKEKTCIADYGDIGGVQRVNCRLAASELPPSETLNYMLTETPKNNSFVIKFVHLF